MYSWHRYRADIRTSWKPAAKSMRAFGSSLLTLDPSAYIAPCFRMTARLLGFGVQFAFFTIRKSNNR